MKTLLTIVVGGLALVSSALYAGAAATGTGVSIDFDEGVAEGMMWPARSSKNDFEAIGCAYGGDDSGNWATCTARDADGLAVWCLTDNPYLMDAAKSISAFSWVKFSFVNATYNPDRNRYDSDCTRIVFSTRSQLLPDFTTKRK